MFGLGMGEVLLILAFALIFIGPKKLPPLARSLGRGIREFQRGKEDLLHQLENTEETQETQETEEGEVQGPTKQSK